jgi:hypothetical protein
MAATHSGHGVHDHIARSRKPSLELKSDTDGPYPLDFEG